MDLGSFEQLKPLDLENKLPNEEMVKIAGPQLKVEEYVINKADVCRTWPVRLVLELMVILIISSGSGVLLTGLVGLLGVLL
ncbi:hypothetical protein NDU88_004110 [Pleurodeles waltl]|uniref:Uncharacterized protein n=1 Tax=Pleurodeles waltl TaxID=8319 RepID=A0AAV7MSJ7_PLEWA|nr:hypothetical protein NDU88_004110 [Pleurodeles waltl]